MPDSIGHHRRFKAGREVKVSTAYLGGLAVTDKHGTVVTSANTTRTTRKLHVRFLEEFISYCLIIRKGVNLLMISVAMASYNGEKFIKKQLISLLNQTTKIDEIIICDDCSTDNTVQIIKNIQSLYKDFNIQLFINKENVGYKKNFKNVLSKCKGNYIFLCDQDDVWKKNKVEKMVSIMKADKKIKVLASSYELIDSNDNIIQSSTNLYKSYVSSHSLKCISFEELIVGNSFQGCSLCITPEINDKFQKCFDIYFHHDWLINLYASEIRGMYYVNEALFQYRIHENNAIGLAGLSNVDYDVKSLEGRLKTAKDCLNNLEHLEKVDSEVITNVHNYSRYKEFYINHINYIQKGQFIKLIISNFNRYYKLIKSNKGRIMDMIICLKVFKKSVIKV